MISEIRNKLVYVVHPLCWMLMLIESEQDENQIFVTKILVRHPLTMWAEQGEGQVCQTSILLEAALR